MSRYEKRLIERGTTLLSRVGQWGQPALVRSIQRGTIALTTGNTTNTATITSIDTGNARLVYLGTSSDGDSLAATNQICSLALTNATTITATRISGATWNITVTYEVIEYWPGVIRSVQRGTVTATTAASGTATLATTLQTITKATIDCLGWQNNFATYQGSDCGGRVTLTNTTTVTLNRVGTAGNLTAGYQVVEWY